MSFGEAVLLSAVAGATIFLGLPVGRLRNLSPVTQAMLTAAAAGVILFLIWDILAGVVEPVEEALTSATDGGSVTDFALYATVAIIGLAIGLLSIVALTSRLKSSAASTLDPRRIATGTAIGLGLHNLSEGLAIGSSAASGATQLAVLLVVGFALHNATEGFGIAAPLTSGARPSWAFLGVLGVIGGGPTFLGGVLGYWFASPVLSILFLAIAAGALIYVFNEMMAVCRRFAQPMAANVALLIGLLVAFATDFLLVVAGA